MKKRNLARLRKLVIVSISSKKKHAIQHYVKNIIQIVEVLGNFRRVFLKIWIEEYNPMEAERSCQTFKPPVRC